MPIKSPALPPELVVLIFEQLFVIDPSAARTASQCTRQYRDLALPILYRSIRIGYNDQTRKHPKTFLELLLAHNGKKARHVQNILISSWKSIKPPFLEEHIVRLLQAVNRLKTFTWDIRWLIPMLIVQELNTRWPHSRLFINSFYSNGGDEIGPLLGSPSLYSLKASLWNCKSSHLQDIINIIKSCPNLRIFEYDENGGSGARPFIAYTDSYALQLHDRLPPLTRLVLCDFPALRDSGPYLWANAADWSNLKYLRLETWSDGELMRFLDAFVGRTPVLRELHLSDRSNSAERRLRRLYLPELSTFLSKIDALETLVLMNISLDESALALGVFHHSQSLRTFSLHYLESVFREDERRAPAPHHLLELARAFSNLERLTIDIDLDNRSHEALLGLCQLPKLQYLEIYTRISHLPTESLEMPPIDEVGCATLFRFLKSHKQGCSLQSLVIKLGDWEDISYKSRDLTECQNLCKLFRCEDADSDWAENSTSKRCSIIDGVKIEAESIAELRSIWKRHLKRRDLGMPYSQGGLGTEVYGTRRGFYEFPLYSLS